MLFPRLNIFNLEYANVITYKTAKEITYMRFENHYKYGKMPFETKKKKPIISYDIDILSRVIFFTTEIGLYYYNFGKYSVFVDESIKITDYFTTGTKIRFDNIGKLLYISNSTGIYISNYPYTNFHQIIKKTKISNYEIIPEIGYNLEIIEL